MQDVVAQLLNPLLPAVHRLLQHHAEQQAALSRQVAEAHTAHHYTGSQLVAYDSVRDTTKGVLRLLTRIKALLAFLSLHQHESHSAENMRAHPDTSQRPGPPDSFNGPLPGPPQPMAATSTEYNQPLPGPPPAPGQQPVRNPSQPRSQSQASHPQQTVRHPAVQWLAACWQPFNQLVVTGGGGKAVAEAICTCCSMALRTDLASFAPVLGQLSATLAELLSHRGPAWSFASATLAVTVQMVCVESVPTGPITSSGEGQHAHEAGVQAVDSRSSLLAQMQQLLHALAVVDASPWVIQLADRQHAEAEPDAAMVGLLDGGLLQHA